MLFMMVGFLKPGAEEQLVKYHDEFNQLLSQPYHPLTAAGVLRGADGKRCGYMAFVEADSIEEAKRYRDLSPFYREHLYERSEVLQYDVQVGRLG